MTRVVLCLLVVAFATPASAEEPSTPEHPADDPIAKARAAHDRGDFAEARTILLDAYAITPLPPLLFAIGQEELNLGNYDAAIAFYERFIATNPSEEQVSLAQQAIGAARMRRAQKPAPPSPPVVAPPVVVHHRSWRIEDTGLIALGGISSGLGVALIVYSRTLARDRSGTLSDYDKRLDNARTTRWTGLGIASAGALLATAAIVRWRLRPDGPALTAMVAPAGGEIAVSGAW